MNRNTDISVRLIRPLLAYLQGSGVNVASLLGEFGIEPSMLFNGEAFLSQEVVLGLYRRAEEVSGDPDIGLHILRLVDVRLVGALPHYSEYLVIQVVYASATVGEGLSRLSRCLPFTVGGLSLDVEQTAERVFVRYRFTNERPSPRAFVDFLVGIWLMTVRESAARPLASLEARFSFPRPPAGSEHERILGVPVSFDTVDNGFGMHVADLPVPLRGANATVAAALEARINELMEARNPDRALANRVRSLVAERLPGGAPSAEEIAAELGVSVRTLSRRLDACGTTHRAILDDVRITLARRYLIDSGMTVEEVTRRLGFSEASAFHRAFKRWFGQGPVEFCLEQRPHA